MSFWEITQRGQMPYTFAGRITGPLLSLWIPTSVLLQSVSGRLKVQGNDAHMHFHENTNVDLSLE